MAKQKRRHQTKRFKRGRIKKLRRDNKIVRSKSSKSNRAHKRIRRKRGKVSKALKLPSGDAFENAFKLLREGFSQKRSAAIAGVSTKRFRHFLRGHKLARFRKGRWHVTDRRTREIRIVSEGRSLTISVRGFARASLGMRHRAALRRFLDSNDIAELAPFKGQAISDVRKRVHILETRPNVLLRLANTGGDADMKIYRLID
jgi:hypothetical protein